MKGFIFISIFILISSFTIINCEDVSNMMRRSIIFDLKTPKVFYCPKQKPNGMERLIVRAVPLDKLCEYDGAKIPKDHEIDCYDDVDESDYACAEKQRIMLRLNPPKDSETTTMIPSPDAPDYIIDKKKQIYEKKGGKTKIAKKI